MVQEEKFRANELRVNTSFVILLQLYITMLYFAMLHNFTISPKFRLYLTAWRFTSDQELWTNEGISSVKNG